LRRYNQETDTIAVGSTTDPAISVVVTSKPGSMEIVVTKASLPDGGSLVSASLDDVCNIFVMTDAEGSVMAVALGRLDGGRATLTKFPSFD